LEGYCTIGKIKSSIDFPLKAFHYLEGFFYACYNKHCSGFLPKQTRLKCRERQQLGAAPVLPHGKRSAPETAQVGKQARRP
jgi:hypothetical protein